MTPRLTETARAAIETLQHEHREVLVITADPANDGQTEFGVYHKFDSNNSRLAEYLELLLRRLRALVDAKCDPLPVEAAISAAH